MYKLILLLGAYIRKIYDPLIYHLFYRSFLKRMIKQDEEIDSTLPVRRLRFEYDPEKEMGFYQRKPEPFNGFIDFTYRDFRLFISKNITDRWGRDCNDFAEQWFNIYEYRASKVFMILLSEPVPNINFFKNSHFIVLVKRVNDWIICDNNSRTFLTIDDTDKLSIHSVMDYYSIFEYKKKIVWVVYKTGGLET